jgi:glutathione S-transferase
MRLRWSKRSPFVRKVMVCAHEMGLVDRLELVETHVSMLKPHPDLMRSNPLGRIPTLETDDGQILYDSALICEYLDTLHKGRRLFPTEPERRWPALRRHALATGLIEVLVPWRNERLRPEVQRSPEILSHFELKTRNAVTAFEQEVEALTATPIDIGHVTMGCALGYLDFRFADLGWRRGHDRLAAWYETFAARPSMQATVLRDPVL